MKKLKKELEEHGLNKLKEELEEYELKTRLVKWYFDNLDKLTAVKTVDKKVKLIRKGSEKQVLKNKTIKKALIHFNIMLIASILIACGSDDIVNNVTNPPPSNNDSLVFSVDSLTVWGTGINTNDTTLFNVFQTGDSVKATFNTSTNCTASDTGYISFNCGNIQSSLATYNMQSSYTLYGKYETFGTGILLYLKSTSLRYLKLLNIKFYKVNPV